VSGSDGYEDIYATTAHAYINLQRAHHTRMERQSVSCCLMLPRFPLFLPYTIVDHTCTSILPYATLSLLLTSPVSYCRPWSMVS